MTKDVLISISGNHVLDGDNSELEIITAGDYYQRNGSHYILYDEVMEGMEGVIKNMIKIRPDGLDIIKKGLAKVHMTFERNKKNIACYITPLGEMMIGLNTNQFSVNEGEDSLKVEVEYSLDINYEHVSDCNIIVDIQSKATADIHLQS